MASASAQNAQGITSTTGVTIFDPATSGKCTAFYINNRSGGVALLVNVAGLHAAGEFMAIETGKDLTFRCGQEDIGIITVKVASGTATIDACKLAKL
jgi:hypothetical protein